MAGATSSLKKKLVSQIFLLNRTKSTFSNSCTWSDTVFQHKLCEKPKEIQKDCKRLFKFQFQRYLIRWTTSRLPWMVSCRYQFEKEVCKMFGIFGPFNKSYAQMSKLSICTCRIDRSCWVPLPGKEITYGWIKKGRKDFEKKIKKEL